MEHIKVLPPHAVNRFLHFFLETLSVGNDTLRVTAAASATGLDGPFELLDLARRRDAGSSAGGGGGAAGGGLGAGGGGSDGGGIRASMRQAKAPIVAQPGPHTAVVVLAGGLWWAAADDGGRLDDPLTMRVGDPDDEEAVAQHQAAVSLQYAVWSRVLLL